MQTFLPFEDFAQSAAVLDPKRLGNQIKETFQILTFMFDVRMICEEPHPDYPGRTIPLSSDQWWLAERTSQAFANHPAVNMWRGYTYWLMEYDFACYQELKSRNRDHVSYSRALWLVSEVRRLGYLADGRGPRPPWLGVEAVHRSHQSKLIQKLPIWYRPKMPENVPDDLEYIWPVQQCEACGAWGKNYREILHTREECSK